MPGRHCFAFVCRLLLLLASPSLLPVHGLNNGLSLTPAMGWNEYNHYANRLNESIVRRTAEALVSLGLAQLGYQFVNLDDCWQIGRDNRTRRIVIDKTQFPSGMAPLAAYVHSLGLKFGLYSDAGTRTCAGRPGSLGYEEIDAFTYAEWNVDFLKYDNCNDDGIDPKVRYHAMSAALNHTGRPILFSMCEWGVDDPATWAAEFGNSWRTTGDISARWDSLIANVRINDKWWSYAGPGGFNDPDMLEVGVNPSLSFIEQRTHFILWAIMKSPLILGMDLTQITSDELSIVSNAEVIAINQDALGIQAHHINAANATTAEVWAGPLSGGDVVVVLFNSGASPITITVDWVDVGLPRNTRATVRDLWAHQDLGASISSFTGNDIASHDCLVLRISPVIGTLSLWVAPTGKDQAMCSATAPCRTIGYAFAQAKSGDVVYVMDGKYGDEVLIGVNGSIKTAVTIASTGAQAVCSSLTLAGVQHIIVDGLTVQHSKGASVTLSHSTNIILTDMIITNSAGYGITGKNASYLTLSNITIDTTGDHGIYLGGPMSHITVINSRIFNSAKIGLHLDPYVYSAVNARDRRVLLPVSDGGPTYLTDVLVQGNLFSGNLAGDVICAGLVNSSIINNVMYGVNLAIGLFSWLTVSGPSHVRIEHNTAYLVASEGRSFGFYDVVGPLFLRDNLIITAGDNSTALTVTSFAFGNTTDASWMDSDYNMLSSVMVGNKLYSLAQWQAAVHLDAHSIDSARTDAGRVWVKPAALPTGDYHLKPRSPAIGRGALMADASYDLDSHWRGGHAPSLGAYEFESGPSARTELIELR